MANTTRTQAALRNGYRPSVGSGTDRMNHRVARPPMKPTPAPTTICSVNVLVMCANAPALRLPAARRLAISAIPTGSFAPDSPSRIVPLRPDTSRCPRTEKTTAGSVGETAVARSTAGYHAMPNVRWTKTATAPTVRKVPATPRTVIGAAAALNLDHPMCWPPSNRIQMSARVTSSSTRRSDGACSPGKTWTASAAAARTRSGAGTLMRSVNLVDSTASRPTTATSSTLTAKSYGSDTMSAPQSAFGQKDDQPTRLPGTPR